MWLKKKGVCGKDPQRVLCHCMALCHGTVLATTIQRCIEWGVIIIVISCGTVLQHVALCVDCCFAVESDAELERRSRRLELKQWKKNHHRANRCGVCYSRTEKHHRHPHIHFRLRTHCRSQFLPPPPGALASSIRFPSLPRAFCAFIRNI